MFLLFCSGGERTKNLTEVDGALGATFRRLLKKKGKNSLRRDEEEEKKMVLGVRGELKTLVHDGLDVHSGQNKFLKENVSFFRKYTTHKKERPPSFFFKVER